MNTYKIHLGSIHEGLFIETSYEGYRPQNIDLNSWTIKEKQCISSEILEFPTCTGKSDLIETFALSVEGVFIVEGPLTSKIEITETLTPWFDAGSIAFSGGIVEILNGHQKRMVYT